MSKSGKLRSLHESISYEDQLRIIYRDLFQDLYVYARSITHSDDLAKDAVAEVFVSLWESRINLSQITKIRAYLLMSVKNECIKSLYQLKRFSEPVNVEQVEKINPEEILLERELKNLIDGVIASLPEQCQLIFKMNSIDQLSYKEIAKELNVTTSTVGNQISRAIRMIRLKIMEEYKFKNDRVNSQIV